MCIAALKSPEEIQAIRKHLESKSQNARYEKRITGTGGEVLIAPEETEWPHLALVSDDIQKVRLLMQSMHRDLHPKTIISTGLIDPCYQKEESLYFIPTSCRRAAGRIDIGRNPVLYEEIFFNDDTQLNIAQTLLKHPAENKETLFGAQGLQATETDKNWIYNNLSCQAYDNYTAELMLVGKRFGSKVGCFKIFSHQPNAIEALVNGWDALI